MQIKINGGMQMQTATWIIGIAALVLSAIGFIAVIRKEK
jgi:hypothetical protein